MRRVKRAILRSGIRPSPRLDFLNALLTLGDWLRTHPAPVYLDTREKLYEHVAGRIGDRPIDYLEAGVFRGDSIRRWTELSTHSDSRFVGFDTFHGLPEAWETGLQTIAAGTFDVGGAAPRLDDQRVRFVQGRFQETVPVFLSEFRPAGQLVVHCDADLYTSTLFFLTALNGVMTPGTYLLFDNFSVATHDFRAFCNYVDAYCRPYEIVATAECDCEKVAFRLL
jgi:hypothetical protein